VSEDSKNRFSNRVSDYSRYRPSYPQAVIDFVFEQHSFKAQPCIADIGAGTGLFTKLLLSKGVPVVAVEPNDAMRSESDENLSQFDNYTSTAGSAEQTLLPDNSVDLITAAQAFHWFKFSETKAEFARILKPEGRIVLVWNRRDSSSSKFLSEYETLLKSGIPEYNQVSHSNASDELIEEFLGPGLTKTVFANYQEFDLDGLKGRLLSSSYCPAKGVRGHDELMLALESLYHSYATQTGVRFDYSTQVYKS